MAKDMEGTQTVPIFNPDGSILGMTTPEKANLIAGSETWSPALSGNFQLSPNNTEDTIQGKYLGGDLIHFGPENGGITLPASDTYFGSAERAREQMGDGQLSLGNPPGMGITGDEGDTRPGGEDWAGVPITPEDPTGGGAFTPPTGGPQPSTPVEWGRERADLSGDEYNLREGWDTGGQFDPMGYEGSSNQDFYAQQFANLRAQQFRNALREGVARNRQGEINRVRNQALDDAAERNPWAWAGGEDQFSPALGTGEALPTSWAVNDKYAGMTNQEAWNAMRDLDVFSDRDVQGYVDNYFTKNPDLANRMSWGSGTDPNSVFAAVNPSTFEGMNHANKARNAVSDIIRNMYVGTGQGPMAPVGYASPLSPAGGSQ